MCAFVFIVYRLFGFAVYNNAQLISNKAGMEERKKVDKY